LFTNTERLALAGLLAAYSGLTRQAYELDPRQYAGWYQQHHLRLFQARRADIESLPATPKPAAVPGWRVSGPAGASCAAGDPVEDGAEPEPELIVGEVGRRGGRVLGHGGDQAGEAFGVSQPQ